MSSIQVSDAENKALAAEIKAVSFREKVYARPILQALFNVIDTSPGALPLLHKWISQIQGAENIVKINASETTVSKITEIFGLGKEEKWSLVGDSLVEVSSRLKRNLRDLNDAFYDEDSEASCRIAIDIMFVQCRIYLRNKYKSAETSDTIKATFADTIVADTTVANATNSSTPKRVVNKPAAELAKHVKLFPEASLSIEIDDPFVLHRRFRITGRADWAFGYSTADEGALLVAIEAKQRSEFSKGEAQLIAYLAILREKRIRAEKNNTITQGFYSDGSRYSFICIATDGTINRSRTFTITFASDLMMAFNFVITMMETAMKSTPSTSPTKPSRLEEKGISHFKSEIWAKVSRQRRRA